VTEHADLVIVGAGAAGLMGAIWAGRAAPTRTIIALDGARKLGAKILVAGGGRCNVTHDVIDPNLYAGSSPNAIRKVLRRFDVEQTAVFFRDLGVILKREDTGKLFPITDDAQTVLDALLTAVRAAGVDLRHPRRVEQIERREDGFRVRGAWGEIAAAKLILATGGKSLPKSGSDGAGYALARRLGVALTDRIFPALAPLTLPREHVLCSLSGVAAPAALNLHGPGGKRLHQMTGALLCTHFGLSGPAALDFSRYFLDAQFNDPAVYVTVNWLPDLTPEQLETDLVGLGKGGVLRWLARRLPERLARALMAEARVEPGTTGDALSRAARRALVQSVTQMRLPLTGTRGFTYAEVTAGGVPLSEVRLETMEARACPGLHLCGEICDVDGPIGGYNFQWAWASGYVAGVSA
jgi:predicted Rossmann fold flavoprotein